MRSGGNTFCYFFELLISIFNKKNLEIGGWALLSTPQRWFYKLIWDVLSFPFPTSSQVKMSCADALMTKKCTFSCKMSLINERYLIFNIYTMTHLVFSLCILNAEMVACIVRFKPYLFLWLNMTPRSKNSLTLRLQEILRNQKFARRRVSTPTTFFAVGIAPME